MGGVAERIEGPDEARGAPIDRDVPHVTGWLELPYAIANTPLAGYLVRETVPVARLSATTDRVYVLAQEPRAGEGAGGG